MVVGALQWLNELKRHSRGRPYPSILGQVSDWFGPEPDAGIEADGTAAGLGRGIGPVNSGESGEMLSSPGLASLPAAYFADCTSLPRFANVLPPLRVLLHTRWFDRIVGEWFGAHRSVSTFVRRS